MSDTEVSSIISEDAYPQERRDFIFPVTRVGINAFFLAFVEEFNNRCKNHQNILNQYHVMLAYQDSGNFPRDVLQIAGECSFDEQQLSEIREYASKLFESKLHEASERYVNSQRSNLNWPYNGSRKCFVEWVALQYPGPSVGPLRYQDLRNMFGRVELEDSEKYFHFRAKMFYTNVYLPKIETMTSSALALRAQQTQEFVKELDVDQVVQRMVGKITIPMATIEGCKMQ